MNTCSSKTTWMPMSLISKSSKMIWIHQLCSLELEANYKSRGVRHPTRIFGVSGHPRHPQWLCHWPLRLTKISVRSQNVDGRLLRVCDGRVSLDSSRSWPLTSSLSLKHRMRWRPVDDCQAFRWNTMAMLAHGRLTSKTCTCWPEALQLTL